MPQHPQTPNVSQPAHEPGWEAVVDRVQASLATGGCVTSHFGSDAEFERARVAVRRQRVATRLSNQDPRDHSWRA